MIVQLANSIQLDFKSTNKWLWDRKNRQEKLQFEK